MIPTTTTPPAARTPVEALRVLQPFLSRAQFLTLRDCCRGEEKAWFIGRALQLASLIDAMPRTYDTDGRPEKVASLHYFRGGCDWYIIELDRGAPDDTPADFQRQAFGLASLGYAPELGYISIPELLEAGAELDLHFEPKPISRLRAGGAA